MAKVLDSDEEEVATPDLRALLARLHNDILPKILEVDKKCDFLISNNGLDETYKKFLAKGSDDSFLKPAKAVCEFYGYPLCQLENVHFWAGINVRKQEHLDILFAYWDFKSISYSVDNFTVTPFEK